MADLILLASIQGKMLLELHSVSLASADAVRTGFEDIRALVIQSTQRTQNQQDEPKLQEQEVEELPPGDGDSSCTAHPADPTDLEAQEPPVDLSDQSVQDNADDVIRITTSVLQPARCTTSCSCQCHGRRTQYTSPTWLQSMLGLLFVDYNVIPVPRRWKCDHKGCSGGRKSPEILLTYCFPSWFWRRAVSFRGSLSSVVGEGASLHLSVPRVLRNDDIIFTAARNTNLAQLKYAMSRRMYAPTDIDEFGSPIINVCFRALTPIHPAQTWKSLTNMQNSGLLTGA